MANFNAAALTKKGIRLLAKTQAGQTGIQFTKAVSGSGSYASDEPLIDKEALKDQKQEFPIDKLSVINDTTVSIRFSITNQQESGNLTEGYYVKEVGLFAVDSDEGEVLYAIATAVEDQWDYMPAYNSLMPAYITVEFYAEVSNAANVTINCSGRFVTAEELEKELSALRDAAEDEHRNIREEAKTAHKEITDAIAGLGGIPEGVLTREDKGVANGVASLNHEGDVPEEQLPRGSGASYMGVKLAFADFTWRSVERQGHTGWVGTHKTSGLWSTIDNQLVAGWNELLAVLDPNKLYHEYTAAYAEYLACAFSSLNFTACARVEGTKCELRIFSDGDLSKSEAAEVAFWLFILRKDRPSY